MDETSHFVTAKKLEQPEEKENHAGCIEHGFGLLGS